MHEPIICIAGKNEIAVGALLYLIRQGYHARLVTCPNKSDDGTSNWQPSLVRFSREYGVRMISLDEAEQIEPLVFISLEFDRIIKPSRFRSKRLYNIHFSALPAFKGMYTSAVPILKGAKESGVTLHEIDSGIDTGSIIEQRTFDIPEECTARDLYFLYMSHADALFRATVDGILSYEDLQSKPQSARGSSYYSKDAIDYGAIQIMTKNTAEGILQQIKAFSFREYQMPQISETTIGGWRISNDRSYKKPGSFVLEQENQYRLSSIDYDLLLSVDRSWEWFDWLSSDQSDQPTELNTSNINLRDKKGWTHLIRAAYSGDIAACGTLLEFGADPNLPNMNGTTPLMYARSSNNWADGRSCAAKLLKFGANPDAQGRFGKSLFDYGHN